MSIFNENPGAPGTGCLYNGAFGFGLIASANGAITNLTVDAAGAYGRPFKATASRWNTLNSLTVKNGVQAYNGISLEYYSSHNTFNNCVVTNNGAGTGTGTGNAGINSFGNFNQYNTFNNCTVSGNGNVQFYVSSYDALRLAQDSNVRINGGTFTGSKQRHASYLHSGANPTIIGATVNGGGSQGIAMDYNAAVGASTSTSSSSGAVGLGHLLKQQHQHRLGQHPKRALLEPDARTLPLTRRRQSPLSRPGCLEFAVCR